MQEFPELQREGKSIGETPPLEEPVDFRMAFDDLLQRRVTVDSAVLGCATINESSDRISEDDQPSSGRDYHTSKSRQLDRTE